MVVQIGIIVVLITVGVLVWLKGGKFISDLLAGEAEAISEEAQAPTEPREPVGPVGPDCLMVLFGDRFVDRPQAGKHVSPRLRSYAPLTEEELDSQHWAQQIIYVTLVGLYEQGSIDFRTVERMATLMPPYPSKTWELQLSQVGPMPESPISDALAVAFGLLRRRDRNSGASDSGASDSDERHWVSLDSVLEQALKTMRQEMTFWQRSGVYGDIRQYVEAALIAQGYLIEPSQPTWLDRVRTQRPGVHEEGVLRLERQAEELAKEIADFRARHGGNLLAETPREVEALQHVNEAILSPPEDAPELPIDEVLRISIYETLIAIRQLEPSGDAGV